MMAFAVSISRRLLFVMPILAAGFWLFTEKGCVLAPDAAPTPALTSTATEIEPPLTFKWRIQMNRSRPWSQRPPEQTCSGCGKPVDLNEKNALVEAFEEQGHPSGGTTAWHRHCFDHFLDEGEEI